MSRFSKWRQLSRFDRFDMHVFSTPSLIHSHMPREFGRKLHQSGLCKFCWATQDELDFMTREGVVDGRLVAQDNLGVIMVLEGHSHIFADCLEITSFAPPAKRVGARQGAHLFCTDWTAAASAVTSNGRPPAQVRPDSRWGMMRHFLFACGVRGARSGAVRGNQC
jgi:hypothetical protein